MTYFEEAFPEGRKDGTIYGVPYTYSLERDCYKLPDGTYFSGEDFGSLQEYVSANLGKFAKNISGSRGHIDAMRAISADMERMMNEAINEALSTTTASTPPSSITAKELITQMDDAIKKIGPPPTPYDPAQRVLDQIRARRASVQELDAMRLEISRKNAKIQKEWDKAFQAEVVKLVRIAMETGQAKVTYMVPVAQEVHTLGGPTATTIMAGREPRMAAVTYNPWLPTEMAAYRDVREQAEKVVRLTMKPPELEPML